MATTTTRSPVANRPPSTKATRDFLAEVSTAAKPKPVAMVLYGPPGIGKTSWGAAIPGAIFLYDYQEDGINTLKQSQLIKQDVPTLPPAATWDNVLGSIESLVHGEHDYKALVIDAIGGIERLCHEHVCSRDFHGDWGDRGFTSYQRGYDVSLNDWRGFLNGLDELRSKRGMRVILLAHSQVKPFKNPYGEDYDRYVPDCHYKTWNLTHKWSDAVIFANYYVAVDTKGGRPKGHGGQERIMYTEYHAAYEAKNRYGLPGEISMGNSGQEAWDNFVAAIQERRAK